MFKTFSTKLSAVAIAATTAFISTASVFAQPISPSVNGRYEDLIQTIYCPGDEASYGDFNDYGYWGGGSWCGEDGEAGYWVYDYPNWYVWEYNNYQDDSALDAKASAYGAYSDLVQVITCAADVDAYGNYNNYGYWGGGSWCGEDGEAGYWVYSYPNWYVWSSVN